MNHFRVALSVLILAVVTFLCQQIVVKSVSNQQNKMDYAEVNHIKYGLFSINRWKVKLSGIIADEISKINLSRSNEQMVKAHLEVQLRGLIDNVDKKIRESNKGTTKGRLKQAFINALVDVKEIKKGVPQFADDIIAEMTKPETENQLKKIVKNQVEHYFNKTFEKQDLSRLDAILLRLGVSDIETARVQLHREIKATQKEMDLETWLLIALAVSAFAWMGFAPRKLELSQCLGMIYVLLGLLFVGVTTPMIDMEAKISQMSFVLLDHPIEFVNQVLYFQTKSILDVFWIMITHSFLQMKVVGILMITFSIFFPLLKMFCSVGYYKNYRNAQERRWVKFFVLKSGKWSMSDVLVVAIFMAYIGFNGIITSQLGNLSAVDQDIVLLTTNGTSLQPGFYIFLTYTMLALFLSSLLSKRREECS